jgi:hypothetical protein
MRTAILALIGCTVQAATVSVPASNFGFYNQAATYNSNNNHAIGYYTGQPPGELRNFFVFNLTGFSGKITSAKLRAYNSGNPIGYSSPHGSETFTIFDVSTPVPSLTALTGGVAAFTDLGSGTALGSVTVTAASLETSSRSI